MDIENTVVIEPGVESEVIKIETLHHPTEWTIGRYCALCGESFPTYPSNYETICPECKKVWAKLKQWVLNWEDNE
jgi:hypothetical protein